MKKRTIIGLAVIAAAVATMFAAPTVASATGQHYVMAVWENPAGSPKFPQDLVTSYKTNSTDPNILGKYATECGTFYQSDIYQDDDRTANLIAGKVLRGGDESWPLDAQGNQIQRYATLTTDPCPVVTPPPVVTPEPTPPVVTEPPVVVPPVITTPIPVPPVTAPEVPSSPDTPPSPTPPTPPTPTAIPTTSNPTATPTGAPVTPSTATSVAPSQPTAQTDALAYTGSDNWKIGGLAGLLLILTGGIVVVIRKITDRKAI